MFTSNSIYLADDWKIYNFQLGNDADTEGYVDDLLETCKLRQGLVLKWYSVPDDK